MPLTFLFSRSSRGCSTPYVARVLPLLLTRLTFSEIRAALFIYGAPEEEKRFFFGHRALTLLRCLMNGVRARD
jgi:hypothetical protein